MAVKCGANINAKNNDGLTPLHVSLCAIGSLERSFLIKYGADPTIPSPQYSSVLDHLLHTQRLDRDTVDSARLFVSKGAKSSHPNLEKILVEDPCYYFGHPFMRPELLQFGKKPLPTERAPVQIIFDSKPKK